MGDPVERLAQFVTANQARFSVPWRRILGIPERATEVQGMALDLVPVVQVADLSYAAGQPNQRGALFSATMSAGAARRVCIVGAPSTGAAWRLELLTTSVACRAIFGTTAALRALGTFTDITTASSCINRSGLKTGGASTLAVLSGDVANATIAAAFPAALSSGGWFGTLGIFPAVPLEFPANTGMAVVTDADATDLTVQAAALEYMDWPGR